MPDRNNDVVTVSDNKVDSPAKPVAFSPRKPAKRSVVKTVITLVILALITFLIFNSCSSNVTAVTPRSISYENGRITIMARAKKGNSDTALTLKGDQDNETDNIFDSTTAEVYSSYGGQVT
jgi:hypothetical protein